MSRKSLVMLKRSLTRIRREVNDLIEVVDEELLNLDTPQPVEHIQELDQPIQFTDINRTTGMKQEGELKVFEVDLSQTVEVEFYGPGIEVSIVEEDDDED